MTITCVQSRGATTDASITLAFAGNITAGNRIVIAVYLQCDENPVHPFVVGDIAKTAGTATIGSWTLDVDINHSISGNTYQEATIFSAPVTGTGSCTITITDAGKSGLWSILGIAEFHSDAGDITLEDTDKGEDSTGAPTTGDAVSVGAAVFVGALSFYTSSGAQTITEDAAFTLIYEEQDGNNHGVGSSIYRIVSSGTTDAASWTSPTTKSWGAVVAVYKEPVSGASTPMTVTGGDTPSGTIAKQIQKLFTGG
jgi:hypothetical protein